MLRSLTTAAETAVNDHSEEVTLQASKPEDRQRQHRQPRKATTVGRILPTDTRPGHQQLVAERKHVPAPVTIATRQLRPSGEAIVPANVKRTVAPVRPGRFEPTGPVIGGFATMRPGEYLPETGFSSYLGPSSSKPSGVDVATEPASPQRSVGRSGHPVSLEQWAKAMASAGNGAG